MGRWMLLILCGCATPQVTAKATAAVQGGAGEQVGAESGSQSGSSAGVKVKRGARHFSAEVVPSADGGLPTLRIGLDDDPDEIEAGAQGEADGGSQGEADAGVSNAAQGSGLGESTPQRFWTAGKIVAACIVGGLLLLAGLVVASVKSGFPPQLALVWKALKLIK